MSHQYGRASIKPNRKIVSTTSTFTTDSRALAKRVQDNVFSHSQHPPSPQLSDARKKRLEDKQSKTNLQAKPSSSTHYHSPNNLSSYVGRSSLGTTGRIAPPTGYSSQRHRSQSFQGIGSDHNSNPFEWKTAKETLVDIHVPVGKTSSYHSSPSPSHPVIAQTNYIGSPSLRQHSSSLSSVHSSTSPVQTSNNRTDVIGEVSTGGVTRSSYQYHHSSSIDSFSVSTYKSSAESSIASLPHISRGPVIATQPDNKVSSRKIVTVPSLCTSHSGLLGLYNTGNTCYMNSVLQCLSHTKPMTDFFLSGEASRSKTKPKRNSIIDTYADFLEQLWKPKDERGVMPTRLRSVLSASIPMIRNSEQQDAQEFLQFLLCCLHEEMNKPNKRRSPSLATTSDSEAAWERSLSYDKSYLSDLFMGQVRSTLKCMTCENESLSFESFWSLSLPLPSKSTSYTSSYVTISECFKLYSAKEKLDKDNKPVCTKCKSPQPNTKKLDVQVFPNILILHLKRFMVRNKYCTKLSSSIQVPTTITVEEIAADKDSVRSFHYELYGVINHSGSISFGHYKADCKHNGKWYTFNDRVVTSSSEAMVTNPSASPYVLFYEKIPH